MKCSSCEELFIVKTNNERSSGGSIKYFYESGQRVFGKRCFSCQKTHRKVAFNKNKMPYYKYEKTKKGFLVRLYRNMKSRILGIQKKKAHLYKGKDILSKEDFYQWADSSKDFHSLFLTWEENSYHRKLTPTVDRIDSHGGYLVSNMRWLTHSENSRLGSLSSHQSK